MPDVHPLFAYTTVATAPSPANSGTSIVLASTSDFPDPASVGAYNCVVCPVGVPAVSSNSEVVRVTAKSGTTLTITRTQEGSSARTILVGDAFYAAITPKTFTDMEPGGADVQEFTADGTWNKPTGAKEVTIVCVGAGGGATGGSGGTGNTRVGGAGGGGGAVTVSTIPASVLGSTVAVTVGVGGTGGNGTTVSGSVNAGTAGEMTTFGTHCKAGGGGPGTSAAQGGGGGGVASNTTGSDPLVPNEGTGARVGAVAPSGGGLGAVGKSAEWPGGSGAGGGLAGAGLSGGSSIFGAGGGGAGGGVVNTTDVGHNGGPGGTTGTYTVGGGGAFGTAGSPGNNGTGGAAFVGPYAGAGGGGAGAGAVSGQVGGIGGDGGRGGGGGGGGGGSDAIGGKGGNGGDGYVLVITTL